MAEAACLTTRGGGQPVGMPGAHSPLPCGQVIVHDYTERITKEADLSGFERSERDSRKQSARLGIDAMHGRDRYALGGVREVRRPCFQWN